MLKEVINFLNLKPGYVVLDATIGGGGHSKEILKQVLPGGRLIGLDADNSSLDLAAAALGDFKGHFKLINANFREIDNILAQENIEKLDGALFDVGVSSYQFENGSRGFSIKKDARLDMRMDTRRNLTAYDIVNRYRESQLSDIIGRFGEERFHKRIARRIVEERSKKPIETTGDLAAIIDKAVGFRYRKFKIDPATRTFQALRIVVNDELSALEEGLRGVMAWLRIGARICVISFHSLEDRIVKNIFKEYAVSKELQIVTKKPLSPSAEEIALNPRSRSGRLRVGERV